MLRGDGVCKGNGGRNVRSITTYRGGRKLVRVEYWGEDEGEGVLVGDGEEEEGGGGGQGQDGREGREGESADGVLLEMWEGWEAEQEEGEVEGGLMLEAVVEVEWL